MAETDPLSQIFTLFAAPLAGAVQSFDQFRSGVDQFQRGVENFNRTMENLNETAERINRLLAEVEEPLRVAVPQFTRSVKAADDMIRVVSGPAMAVAPGLQSLAETLNNPAMRQVPHQLAQMNDVLAEITARLAPLGQFAESAGGIFGGLRFPGFSGGSKPEPTPAESESESEVDSDPEIELPETLTTRRITIAKQTTSAGKDAARENPKTTKSATAKSAPAKSASAESARAKSAPAKSARTESGTRKAPRKKSASQQSASKKTATKKTATKKTASKKTASKKTVDEAT